MDIHPLQALGQGLIKIGERQLRREAELTTLTNINTFTERYAKEVEIAQNNTVIEEDKDGNNRLYVKIKDTSILNNSFIKYNNLPYDQYLGNIYEHISNEIGGTSNNKYAQHLFKRHSINGFTTQKLHYADYETTAKRNDRKRVLGVETGNVANSSDLGNYKEKTRKLHDVMNMADMSIDEREILKANAALFIQKTVIVGLISDKPQTLLNLPTDDHLYKNISIGDIRSYKKNAESSLNNELKNSIYAFEMELPNELKKLKETGNINEEYFNNGGKNYIKNGQGKKAIHLNLQLTTAAFEYTFWQKISGDINDLPKLHQSILFNKPKSTDKNFAINIGIYKNALTEINRLMRLENSDPAALGDEKLMHKSNEELNADQDLNIYQKRLGVRSARVTTNSERDSYIMKLNNSIATGDFNATLDSIGANAGVQGSQVCKELSEAKGIDPSLAAILRTKAANPTADIDSKLNLMTRKRNGDFADYETGGIKADDVKGWKTAIHTALTKEDSFLSSLIPFSGPSAHFSSIDSFSTQKGKDFVNLIYDNALGIMVDSRGDVTLEDAVKISVEKIINAHYHLENDISVPKNQYNFNGRVEITETQANTVTETLEASKDLVSKISDEDIYRIFNQAEEINKFILENNINIYKEALKNGRWILADDDSVYVLQCYIDGEKYQTRIEHSLSDLVNNNSSLYLDDWQAELSLQLILDSND